MMPDEIKTFYQENKHKKFSPLPKPVFSNLHEEFHWIMKSSHAPWIDLDIDMPFLEMFDEAMSVIDRFVAHRQYCGQGWKSLCVHGLSADKTDAPNNYGIDYQDAVYSWTDIADLCPVTRDYFQNHFPYISYQRLRFMLVEPGGYIRPHNDATDYNLGSAINISLNNPDGCELVTSTGTLPFRNSGSVFMFDTSYQHMVYNNSDTSRIHMIVHGVPDSRKLEPIVVKSYQATWENQ